MSARNTEIAGPDGPLLQVRNLSVSLPSQSGSTDVLREISFDLQRGQIVGLLGESGSGKSTLALALLRVLPSDARVSGSIGFDGRDLFTLSEPQMRQVRGAAISIIFQEPGLALNPVLRVGTQITEVLRAHNSWSRRRLRDEAAALLALVELPDVSRIFNSYPHELSGGEAQRVLIAQALACGPALVIADEPTASLDSTIQAEISALLTKLRREKNLSLLFITHNPALLLNFADRVLVLRRGQIVEHGPVPGVFRRPAHEFTQALVTSMNARAMAGSV